MKVVTIGKLWTLRESLGRIGGHEAVECVPDGTVGELVRTFSRNDDAVLIARVLVPQGFILCAVDRIKVLDAGA